MTTCPFCHKDNPLADNVTGKGAPEDGDLSFCIGCGEWAIFASDRDGGCRKPTHAEYEEIVSHDFAQRMRDAWLVNNETGEAMTNGPGKYDYFCTLLREATVAEVAIVVVINGIEGSGFSVQANDPAVMDHLPDLLRKLADDMSDRELNPMEVQDDGED